jgi:hypothetical protein
MKRLVMMLVVLVSATGGCMNPHVFGAKDSEVKETSKRPPAVYPHEINEGNANAMAKALETEMDFDARKSK